MLRVKRSFTFACALALAGACAFGLGGCGGSSTETEDVPEVEQSTDIDATDPDQMSDLTEKATGASAYDDIKAEAEDTSLADTSWSFSSVLTSTSFDDFKDAAEEAMGTDYVDTMDDQIDRLDDMMSGSTVEATDNQLNFTFSTGTNYSISYEPSSTPGIYDLTMDQAGAEDAEQTLVDIYSTCAVVDGNLVLFPASGGGYALQYAPVS